MTRSAPTFADLQAANAAKPKPLAFMRWPERNDGDILASWNSAGTIEFIDVWRPQYSFGQRKITVADRRRRKAQNDFAWLSLLEAHPGADRFGWRGTPMRCAVRGYTEFVLGVERLTAAGAEALSLWRTPF